MPIRADFVGKNIPTHEGEHVAVRLKEVDNTLVIMEQKANVQAGKGGGLPSTYTKIKLPNGTIKETYGERYGRPTDS